METESPILTPIHMSISPLLREMQRKHGGLRKLAKALGLSPGYVSKLVNGKQKPGATSCLAIARLSGKSAEQVIEVAYSGNDARDNAA